MLSWIVIIMQVFCAEMLSAKVTQLFLMVFSSWLFLCHELGLKNLSTVVIIICLVSSSTVRAEDVFAAKLWSCSHLVSVC